MTKLSTNKRFYGWIALIGAALSAFVGGGIFFYAYGVFLPIMCQEFGWSRAIVGLGMTLGAVCFSFFSPLAGITVAKFGARANLIAGNLLGAIGLACMFFAQEVWQVYLFYSLAGFGCGIGGVIPATTIANSWFVKKRSLAVGIIMACGGLGGFIFPLLSTALTGSIGWRVSWVVLGGLLFVGASLIGGVIMARNKPEDMGQLPDGVIGKINVIRTDRSTSAMARESRGWTLRRVFGHPTIWLIIAFGAASGFVSGTIMGHQVAYLRDLGSNPMIAAFTLSVIAAFSIAGSLGCGALAMKFNIRILISIFFVVRLIALTILLTTHNIALIYLHSILFGISNGALGTSLYTIVGTYYGRANFARIQGIVAMSFVLQAAGPVTAGAIYDNTGSYTLAFIIIAGVTSVGLLCAFLARPPRLPEAADTITIKARD